MNPLFLRGRALLLLLLGLTLFTTGCDTNEPTEEDLTGLITEDLVEGDGEAVGVGSRVMFHHVGKLQNGTVFDASADRGVYSVYIVGQGLLMRGLYHGLQGMKAGGTRRITIPAPLAFGSEGRDPVPPNATVVYEVELVRVDDPFAIHTETLREGAGQEAAAGNRLTLHYTGYLGNGTTFDSSRDGDPIVFTLGAQGFIPGWNPAINGIKVGEQRRLVIPPTLGYGAAGRPPQIPSNATLIFDVELTQIEGV